MIGCAMTSNQDYKPLALLREVMQQLEADGWRFNGDECFQREWHIGKFKVRQILSARWLDMNLSHIFILPERDEDKGYKLDYLLPRDVTEEQIETLLLFS